MKSLIYAVIGVMAVCSASFSAEYIGVVSPASCINRDEIEAAIRLLEAHDYKVKLGEYVFAENGYLAGTDQQRADDINAMFRDDEVKMILCTRGGYGAARILDLLDYEMIAQNPKPLIGYSDITALHIVLGEKCGLTTIHGPMLPSLLRPNLASDYTVENFFRGIAGEYPSGEIPMPEGKTLKAVVPGRAEGIIRGGNLTLIASLVGTPYELRGDGALLFLEEVGEKPYRIDRMLNQLWQSGLFDRVNGILLGDFVNCEAPEGVAGTFSLEDVLKHYAELSGKPVLSGIPAGHGEYNMFLPLGVYARMEASEDGSGMLEID
ncbi:MAG: LD-carboxypeptidase [Synergistaceae bacterium]|nr:LD-carboxypeptidase [Synergistaceae bacterium]